MNCPDMDRLRGYLDRELIPSESERVETHLHSCERCRERLNSLRDRAKLVSDALNMLTPTNDEPVSDPAQAYTRFAANMPSEPVRTRGSFSGWRIPALGSVTVACALILLFSFAPAQSWAQKFLSMFRIQKVALVPVDLPATAGDAGNSATAKLISQLISDEMVVTLKPGKPAVAADAQTATQMAGFNVRTLDGLGTPQRIFVRDEAAFHMTINRDRIQDILDQAGRSDIQIPASVDGSTVAVHIPKSVLLRYGTCPQAGSSSTSGSAGPVPSAAGCINFVQVPSPIVSTPPTLNLAALAEAGLQVAGMSAADAQAFCQTVDWTSTLVIPIPQNASSSRTVSVDGVEGSLIEVSPHGSFPGHYALIWVKNGIVYSLGGSGNADQVLALAESMN